MTGEREMTYLDARAGIERTIAANKFAKAEVFIAACKGERFIVKDFGQKGFWERNLIGRIVISRECAAYRSLAGVTGLPSKYLRLSPFALAVEYLEGRDLGSLTPGDIGAGIIRQLERIINDLHGRGWVHLDLQRRSNILLVDGSVYVIDLASAFRPGGVPLVGRLLVSLIGFADRLSLLKMKNLFAPEMLTAADKRMVRLRNLFMPTRW
mgnify:CR=1 FL=1